MPFTPEMRRGIDQIRDYLYGGGYPDPVSNAEQLSAPVLLLPGRGAGPGERRSRSGHEATARQHFRRHRLDPAATRSTRPPRARPPFCAAAYAGASGRVG